MTIDAELFHDLFDYHCKCNDYSPEADRLRFALIDLYENEMKKKVEGETAPQPSLQDELENLQNTITHQIIVPLRKQGKCLSENRDGQYSDQAHSVLQETSGMSLASALQVNKKLNRLIFRLESDSK